MIDTLPNEGREAWRRPEAVQAVHNASRNGEQTVREAIMHPFAHLGTKVGVSFGIAAFRDHMERLLDEHRRRSGN